MTPIDKFIMEQAAFRAIHSMDKWICTVGGCTVAHSLTEDNIVAHMLNDHLIPGELLVLEKKDGQIFVTGGLENVHKGENFN